MIDLSNIENYRENNRIEAKLALGGLPQSIWETYSSFANTLGGIMLLGVEERKDKTLHPVNLPHPERLLEEFFGILNNPARVSANILPERAARIESVSGKRIIVIDVPRALRADRPIYIGDDPFTGTYRRGGEGDYRCTRAQVEAMLRDAEVKSRDMRVIEQLGMDCLKNSSVSAYLGHISASIGDMPCDRVNERLALIGAAGMGKDGEYHPTAAGLLMFGNYAAIKKLFPKFSAEYKDESREKLYTTQNLYEFFYSVCKHLKAAAADDEVFSALREALENCIVNADYYSAKSVIVSRRRSGFVFSNSGLFRLDVSRAESGGVSDPRNLALIKIFSRSGLGSAVGGGIPLIYSVWRKNLWERPQIKETFLPERTTLVLNMLPEKRGRRLSPQCGWLPLDRVIINYLTDKISGTIPEISQSLGLNDGRVRACLGELVAKGIAVCEGSGARRLFRLKS